MNSPPIPPFGANLVICTSSTPAGFSCLITDQIPDLNIVPSAQCFPMFIYEWVDESEPKQQELF